MTLGYNSPDVVGIFVCVYICFEFVIL